MSRAHGFTQHQSNTKRIFGAGFTLIEILVAVGIVVAMLVTLTALVRLSMLQDSARFEELALTIASGSLEDLRDGGYVELPASGALSDERLASLPSGAGSVVVEDGENDTKKVTIVVSWVSRTGAAHDITLSTIFAPSGGLL